MNIAELKSYYERVCKKLLLNLRKLRDKIFSFKRFLDQRSQRLLLSSNEYKEYLLEFYSKLNLLFFWEISSRKKTSINNNV